MAQLVKRYFHGDLKLLFNVAARQAARFAAAFYGPLAIRDDLVDLRKTVFALNADCQPGPRGLPQQNHRDRHLKRLGHCPFRY